MSGLHRDQSRRSVQLLRRQCDSYALLSVFAGLLIIAACRDRFVFIGCPSLFSPEELQGGIAVVIDVLRASSTIAQALFAGAESVIPCADVDEAKQQAANLPAGSYLLGGERGGVKIEGFDLGNSPLEYTPDRVARENDLIHHHQRHQSPHTLRDGRSDCDWKFREFGCGRQNRRQNFASRASGVLRARMGLCPRKTFCGAGAMVDDLQILRGHKIISDSDANRLALELSLPHCREEDLLLEALRESQGGRNLTALGYDEDIQWVAKRNRFRPWSPNTTPKPDESWPPPWNPTISRLTLRFDRHISGMKAKKALWITRWKKLLACANGGALFFSPPKSTAAFRGFGITVRWAPN